MPPPDDTAQRAPPAAYARTYTSLTPDSSDTYGFIVFQREFQRQLGMCFRLFHIALLEMGKPC